VDRRLGIADAQLATSAGRCVGRRWASRRRRGAGLPVRAQELSDAGRALKRCLAHEHLDAEPPALVKLGVVGPAPTEVLGGGEAGKEHRDDARREQRPAARLREPGARREEDHAEADRREGGELPAGHRSADLRRDEDPQMLSARSIVARVARGLRAGAARRAS